jgi:hypothetical protein
MINGLHGLNVFAFLRPSPLRGRWPFALAKGRMGVVGTTAPLSDPPPSAFALLRHLPRKGEGKNRHAQSVGTEGR